MKFTYKLVAPITRSVCALLVFFSLVATAQQTEQSHTTVYRHDLAGRVTGIIKPDPDGAGPLKYPAVRNTYTAGGLLTLVETGELSVWLSDSYQPTTDWNSYFTVTSSVAYEYDNFGRKIKVLTRGSTPSIQSLTQISYDANGRIRCKALRMNTLVYSSLPASACDQSTLGSEGPDRISRYTYDTLDQLTKEERGVGTSLVQNYVINTYVGRLLKTQTDANGNKTELQYDTSGRLTHRFYPSKTVAGAASTTDYNQYGYDANSNINMERKRNGAVINFHYDNNNRLILKDYVNNAQMADIYYNYDLRGITLHSRFGSDSGEGITNKADGFGNIVQTDTTMGGVTRSLRYRYDRNNNRVQIVHPDNTLFRYEFDRLNRLLRVGEGTYPQMLDVVYNTAGRRSALIRKYYNGAIAARTDYYFNDAQRLSQLALNFPGTGSDLTNIFSYNPAGQVTKLTQTNASYQYLGNANRTGAYSINGLNQYTALNGASITYDDNGNLTNDSGAIYQYDDENRLRSTSGTGIAPSTLKYDPLGRLYEIVINGSAVTRFLYDGDALVAEYNGVGTMVRRYVHGDQIDEPLVQYNGASIGESSRRNLYSDHQGSIIAQSEMSGTQVSALSYDAYGIPKSGVADRFGYTGQMWLVELGLYHYKARMYSPRLGRFLQTDPIFYADQMNMYAYVGNDPINMIDVTGKYGVPVNSYQMQQYSNIAVMQNSSINPNAIDAMRVELRDDLKSGSTALSIASATSYGFGLAPLGTILAAGSSALGVEAAMLENNPKQAVAIEVASAVVGAGVLKPGFIVAKEVMETAGQKGLVEAAQETSGQVAENYTSQVMEKSANSRSNSENGMSSGIVRICSGMGAQEGGCD